MNASVVRILNVEHFFIEIVQLYFKSYSFNLNVSSNFSHLSCLNQFL